MKSFRPFLPMLVSLSVYAALLVISGQVTGYFGFGTGMKIIAVALPILGCLFVLFTIVRHIRSIDEFQQRIQFEAIAFAFASTALLTFSWGFLEDAGFPKLPTFAIWPLMGALWAIGTIISTRRFR